MSNAEKEEVSRLLNKHELFFIAQHWQTTESNFDLHQGLFKKHLRHLAGFNPLFINTQTGKDFFTESENIQLINIAEQVSKEAGIAIFHETHRGKWSFAAHITKKYLKKYPHIKLTLDISHWCAVAESFLQDQQEAIDLAIQNTEHLHARIGFTQGPQITDPRAPEWRKEVDIHLKWWDRVIEKHRKNGRAQFTITPEFGAPPYLTLLPFSRQPLVNQWDINVFMMNLLKERYR